MENATKAMLVGMVTRDRIEAEVEDHLDELTELVSTLEIKVLGRFQRRLPKINAGTFLGKGQVEQLALSAEELGADLLVFDEELTPGQVQRLETETGKTIVDRTGIIIEIFSARAQTREAQVQVELARMKYMLPRLTGAWTHLERQKGGIGLRGGPGETQLEVDRRIVRTRIRQLSDELSGIARVRQTQNRTRSGQFHVSLVGYTNAGKSTLLNTLTGSDTLVLDQLFATLDPFTRAGYFQGIGEIMFTDTVGFIRKLPHQLVASFRSTFEQALQADLLLHVVDVSHPHFDEQLNTVNELLTEMDVEVDTVVPVFNKIDRLDDRRLFTSLKEKFPDALFVSASRKLNLDQLRSRVIQSFRDRFVDYFLEIVPEDSRLLGMMGREYQLLETTHENDIIRVRVRVPVIGQSRFVSMMGNEFGSTWRRSQGEGQNSDAIQRRTE